MRILHFIWCLSNGGAENLAVDLANEQSKTNDVILLVGNDLVDDSVRSRLSSAVQYVALGRPEGSKNPYWMMRLLYLLFSLRPDVIHAHTDNLAKLAKYISAPLVLTVHDTNIRLTAASSRFAAVCCISESVLKDISQRYPDLPAHQVNNGINTDAIVYRDRISVKTVRGVQISRLVHEKKGQDLLINALAIVNADEAEPSLTIDFIGDGPSLDYLFAAATEAGVSKYCNFLGSIPRTDVYRNLGTYDILVQPSRFEGFGLTVAEGMAAGMAVVVSDIEGPMEIIDKGVFGDFFQANDVQSLAGSLRKAMHSLETPAGLETRKAARKHVSRKYDLRQTATNYCEVYRSVLNG